MMAWTTLRLDYWQYSSCRLCVILKKGICTVSSFQLNRSGWKPLSPCCLACFTDFKRFVLAKSWFTITFLSFFHIHDDISSHLISFYFIGRRIKLNKKFSFIWTQFVREGYNWLAGWMSFSGKNRRSGSLNLEIKTLYMVVSFIFPGIIVWVLLLSGYDWLPFESIVLRGRFQGFQLFFRWKFGQALPVRFRIDLSKAWLTLNLKKMNWTKHKVNLMKRIVSWAFIRS